MISYFDYYFDYYFTSIFQVYIDYLQLFLNMSVIHSSSTVGRCYKIRVGERLHPPQVHEEGTK